MENRKCIFELTQEQYDALTKFAKVNNKSRAEIIRLFCDSLIDINPLSSTFIVHDDKKLNMTLIKHGTIERISGDKNVVKLDAKISYDKNKSLTSEYKISKLNTVEFGK